MKRNYQLYLVFFTQIFIAGCWESQNKEKPFIPVFIEKDNFLSTSATYTDESGALQPLSQNESSQDLIRYEDETDTGLVGYKNPKGEIKIPAKFVHAGDFNSFGWAEVNFGGQNFYRINKDGNIIHQAYFFDNGADYFVCGFTRIINDTRKVGFANLKGETVIPPQFDWATPFRCTPSFSVVCQGCYAVGSFNRKDSKRCRLSNSDCYSEMIGGKWGAIAPTGKIIIPIEYDKYDIENDQIIFMKDNNKFHLLHDGQGHFKLEKFAQSSQDTLSDKSQENK